ncbi:M64 family metallopeptidase [Kitasatospora sp. DSM 101779]|uniref:M64 family metallopeptidase n=1 Tax=Kitasatospora sp. DSM 101779 TaxID=2853165 RepID=UPI002955949E|nr:M64 family metallopeptidase [Kitasatospora sp. DSM 101779]
MRTRMPRYTALAAGLTLAAALTAPAAAAPNPPAGPAAVTAAAAAPAERTVTAEAFTGPDAEGRRVRVPVAAPGHRKGISGRTAPGDVTGDGAVGRLAVTGPTADRLDVVIVGDGYTADQQDAFHAAAAAKWAAISAIEPYRSYRGLFNVWTVDAVSHDSGISGDPDTGTVRDTALGSYFWCADTERLVCTDLDKVAGYAAKAPAADLVVVVANSAKYGGAGYYGLEAEGYPFDGVSTLSSDNAASSLIAAHEIGHSVGQLHDEYTYDSYGTWTGGETDGPNSTDRTADQLLADRAKWYRWLGADDPAGGTVGTYEGSDYYPHGLYRPTATSIMRALSSTEFNLPGREAMIAGFYRKANGLSSDLPTGSTVRRSTRITVTPAALTGLAAPELRWYLDGTEVRSVRGRTSVVPAALGVRPDGRTHRLTAVSVDRTAAVRDPQVRDLATDSLAWRVAGTP